MFGRKGRRTPFQREMDEELEAIRDDCIALFINSGLSQKQIHERGGPTPHTISKWLYKETVFVRMATVMSLTKALGGRVTIVGVLAGGSAIGDEPRNQRLGLDVPILGRPHMPRRKSA